MAPLVVWWVVGGNGLSMVRLRMRIPWRIYFIDEQTMNLAQGNKKWRVKKCHVVSRKSENGHAEIEGEEMPRSFCKRRGE